MSETPIQAKDEHPCAVYRDCLAVISSPFSGMGSIGATGRALERYGAHMKSCRICTPKEPHHVGNGKHQGLWAFTLTMSPKDAKTVGDMLTAVRKVMRQKSCPVKKFAWYYEDKGRDDNGDPVHPHIHGLYETVAGGRIEAKHWRRAWDIWDEKKPIGAGFRGGYHRPVRSNEGYSDYIKKDGGMSETWSMEDERTE